ncbi:hypothetical protein BS17DRAFT_795262 [Gyrodon lividus]|nr:hypothetical protein BS17DRAFT_795262 [Gyrodon lividus]
MSGEHQKPLSALIYLVLTWFLSHFRVLISAHSREYSGSSSSEDSSSSSEDEPPAAASNIMLYLADWLTISKSRENLRLLLTDWKWSQPEIFHAHVQMTPECFDMLLAALQADLVFQNNSNLPQMPINAQLAIVLYHFGHYAGIGFGTVCLITKPVEKGEAKQWVADNSCPAWHNGRAVVDGTLVPLYARPGYYGNTWYDCKSNYSLNLQVISTPDFWIIDYYYSVGLPGSQHDSTAFAKT